MAMSFSIGELSRFAEAFGVHLDRSGAVDDAARQLIKAVEDKGAERRLLVRLADAKPLVVWPEPPAERAEEDPGEAPAKETAEQSADAEPGPTVFQAPVDAAPPTASPMVDPYLQTLSEAPMETTARSPWLLPVIVSATLVVGVLCGAVVAIWQMSETAGPPEPETPAASVSTLAADMLDGSVGQVAEACDVKREPGESARSVLVNAFRNCRRLETPPSRNKLIPPAPKVNPRPTTRGGRPLPQPRPSQRRSQSGACLDRCHQAYVQCQRDKCGPEPRSAKAYPEWQRCKAGCMPTYGACRSRCL